MKRNKTKQNKQTNKQKRKNTTTVTVVRRLRAPLSLKFIRKYEIASERDIF